jgi:hypothetical protein
LSISDDSRGENNAAALKRKQRFERFNRPIQQRDPSVGRFTRLQAELIKKEKKPKGRKKKIPVAKKKKTEEDNPQPEPETPREEEKDIKPEVEKKIKKQKLASAQLTTATAASSRPRRSIGNYCATNHKEEEEQKDPEPQEEVLASSESDLIKSEVAVEEENKLPAAEIVESHEIVDEKAARDLATIKELMTEMLDRVEKAVVVISKAEELNLSVDDAKNQLTTSGSGSCSRKRKRKSDAPTRY